MSIIVNLSTVSKGIIKGRPRMILKNGDLIIFLKLDFGISFTIMLDSPQQFAVKQGSRNWRVKRNHTIESYVYIFIHFCLCSC